jgi:hypothetical protein
LKVNLYTDGGSNGSWLAGVLTPQSYTYAVYDLSGFQLMAAAQSTWARQLTILTGPANNGYIYFDNNGVMQLGPTDETPQWAACGGS